MKAIYRRARISPKKANLVAGLIRGMSSTEALNTLKFTPKKGADLLHKTLKSAIANAENNTAQDKEKLVIKQILVSPGPVFKRGIPVSKGRMHPILKRNSHITIELEIDTKDLKMGKPKKTSSVEKTVKKVEKIEKSEKKAQPAKTSAVTTDKKSKNKIKDQEKDN
jgi:large subunit ribosomal protein L22